MSATERVVRHLLEQLEQNGGTDEAVILRAGFEARHWLGVGQADVELLLGLIHSSPGAARVVDAPDAPTRPAEPISPVRADYGAFLETVPDADQLLEALEELVRASDVGDVQAALQLIFVDTLRFGASNLIETGRLNSTGSIRDLGLIARHRDFAVSLATMVHPRPYPSSTAPVFALHPYGICFEWYYLRNDLRVSYRVGRDRTIHRRTLVGRNLRDAQHLGRLSRRIVIQADQLDPAHLGVVAPRVYTPNQPGPLTDVRDLPLTRKFVHECLHVPAGHKPPPSMTATPRRRERIAHARAAR